MRVYLFVFERAGYRTDCRGVKYLQTLGVERISFCCPPIFGWLAPAHEHDGAVSITPPPPPTHSHPTLFCLFPKRLAFLGATSEAALEGRPAGSWVASCARAPRGGDNVLLIDWASWAEFRNLQKGETEKWGWGMSWEGWRGGMTAEDS